MLGKASLWTALGVFMTIAMVSHSAEGARCRAYQPQDVAYYNLPWISGISRIVTAGNCSPGNDVHSSDAVHKYNINDATFAYDFRMRYEPVCMMASGWIFEFRDGEPDLEGTRLSGRSNYIKLLNESGRVDYYTHLRRDWWTEQGQPEFGGLDRRDQVLRLKAWTQHLRWVPWSEGRMRLQRRDGKTLTVGYLRALEQALGPAPMRVNTGKCIAWSGSSGTLHPHLHVESRCSFGDSRTCPIHFTNASLVVNGKPQKARADSAPLREHRTYFAW